MNCIKCPILEECKVDKMTTEYEYPQGITIPLKAAPMSQEECSLLAAIALAKVRVLGET